MKWINHENSNFVIAKSYLRELERVNNISENQHRS